jgi:hypothetical protein
VLDGGTNKFRAQKLWFVVATSVYQIHQHEIPILPAGCALAFILFRVLVPEDQKSCLKNLYQGCE